MNQTHKDDKSEFDFMVYKTNSVPGLIKFVWIAFFIFMSVYLLRYFWPDLQLWLQK